MNAAERILIVLLSLAVLLTTARAVVTDDLAEQVEADRTRLEIRQQRVAELEGDVQQLLGEVNRLADDPRALERRVRDELHWARPNEVVFDFGQQEGSGAAAR